VLICAHNEAPRLRTHLGALLEQHYPAPWELLIVDDASSDETPAVLADFKKKYPHLRVIYLPEKTGAGKKYALQTALRQAKHPWLLLTDADCRPASNQWARMMTAPLAAPHIEWVLGHAPFTPQAGAWNAWMRFGNLFTALQYLSMARLGLPYMGLGRNLALKKKALEPLEGQLPHPDLPGGDDDLLVNQLAGANTTAVCVHPAAFVFSKAAPDWRAWLRQKQRHVQPSRRYQKRHLFVLGAFHLSLVVHYGLAAILLILNILPGFVAGAALLRWGAVSMGYRAFFKQIGAQVHWLECLFFDGCTALFEGSILPFLLWGKTRRRW
jgi:poly-beta-1,6-N-acetyl-D-glucosamine synthase